MFSSCFFMLDLFPTFFGNIEKCPFTYWLNGRWFLQMVDIGTFNMKLNGRWFPQIVDSTVGIYIQYIIHSLVLIFDPKRGGGVSFWTCWREISGDRVALFHTQLIHNSYVILIRYIVIPPSIAVSYTFTKVCQRITSELNLWVTYL